MALGDEMPTSATLSTTSIIDSWLEWNKDSRNNSEDSHSMYKRNVFYQHNCAFTFPAEPPSQTLNMSSPTDCIYNCLKNRICSHFEWSWLRDSDYQCKFYFTGSETVYDFAIPKFNSPINPIMVCGWIRLRSFQDLFSLLYHNFLAETTVE